MAEFVRRIAGPLIDHDKARGGDLATTVEEYLAPGRPHTTTAEVLGIHPNTLYQRLERIGTILGGDWREPDKVVDLLVALKLHRFAKTLDDIDPAVPEPTASLRPKPRKPRVPGP